MAVDTILKYRGYNSYQLAANEKLHSDTFDVSLYNDIVSQVSVIRTAGNSTIYVDFVFYNAAGTALTPAQPSWTLSVNNRWTDFWETRAVPANAATLRWTLRAGSHSVNVALPKVSPGKLPTAFSDDTTMRASYLNAEGLYTSTVTADQVKTGVLSSTNNKAWFDLTKPEIVMESTDGSLRWKASPSNPLSIEDANGNQITGLTKFGGDPMLIAGILAADVEGLGGYLRVGPGAGGGNGLDFWWEGHRFMFTFDINYGVQLYLGSSVRQVWNIDGSLATFDAAGKIKLYINSGGLWFYDDNANWRFVIGTGASEMKSPNLNHNVGVNNNGPYYTYNNSTYYFNDIGKTVQKYPDGTMIIEDRATVDVAINTAWGNAYNGTGTITLPDSFYTVNNVEIIGSVTSNSYYASIVSFKVTSANRAVIALMRPNSVATQTYEISYRAKGRWKA